MKRMVDDAGIKGKKLTNHSVRKTMCTTLLNAGVYPTMIQQLSGHKNVQSISNYAQANVAQQKKMCNILTNRTSTVESGSIPGPHGDAPNHPRTIYTSQNCRNPPSSTRSQPRGGPRDGPSSRQSDHHNSTHRPSASTTMGTATSSGNLPKCRSYSTHVHRPNLVPQLIKMHRQPNVHMPLNHVNTNRYIDPVERDNLGMEERRNTNRHTETTTSMSVSSNHVQMYRPNHAGHIQNTVNSRNSPVYRDPRTALAGMFTGASMANCTFNITINK